MAVQEAAQALAGAAAADVKAAEEARDAAAWGCEHPGYVPLGAETVNIPAKPLVTFTLGLDIDGNELSQIDRMMAALIGKSMSEISGLAANDRQQARISERKTIASEEAKRPRVVGSTVAAPGARAVPGGIYSPGARP